MLEKLEKVLDLLIIVLEREIGISQTGVPPGPARRGRKPKTMEFPPREKAPAAAPADPFATIGEEGANNKPTPEELVEAGRQCIEVMGAYIRKHLNDKPVSGQAKAKAIVMEVTGRPPTFKLTELTYEENNALVARFNKELDVENGS